VDLLQRYGFLGILTVIAGILGIFFVVFLMPLDVNSPPESAQKGDSENLQKPLSNPPAVIRGIYFTSASGGDEKKINYLLDLARKTQINAVVVDIKDSSGYIAYDTDLAVLDKYGAERVAIKDIRSLIGRLHAEGLYAIARIVVFQDPVLAKARPDLAIKNIYGGVWRDYKGLSWIDPAASDAWYYNIAIAEDAAKKGFDEINFDYIRFPSDGDLDAMAYPFWDRKISKSRVIGAFFGRLREGLPDLRLSADLFGFTTTHSDDLGIGQILEEAFASFDYIAPMVYPSHYPPTYLGLENPAVHPYEIVYASMKGGMERLRAYKEKNPGNKAEFRPWLQDFDLGADYSAEMVRAQVRATQDALEENFRGFMLWNPRNIYTVEAVE